MHCHSNVTQAVIPSAVLMASLLGSGHCALMCGGLVVSAARSAWQQFFYHVGRLMGYVALGAISGWLGHNAINNFPAGASEVIAWLIALSFIVLGVIGWKGGSWHLSFPGGQALNRWTVSAFQHFTDTKKQPRKYYAGVVGMLSIFLPCGWLYSFVLASISIADPLKGAWMMLVFWIGTLPALIVSPLILKKLFSLTGNYAPKISALLLIAAGILPILFRYLNCF